MYYLKHFCKCTNLGTYCSTNHKPINVNVTAATTLNRDMHGLYMKYFKQEPTTTLYNKNQ